MPTLSLMPGALEDDEVFVGLGRAPPRNLSGRCAFISLSSKFNRSASLLEYGE